MKLKWNCFSDKFQFADLISPSRLPFRLNFL